MISAFQLATPIQPSFTKAHSIHLCPTICQPTQKRPRSNGTKWVCQLPQKLSSLATELAQQPDAKARYLKLADYGITLPHINENELKPHTRVSGCTSITHVEVTVDENELVLLRGYSDAKISRGIVAFLVNGLSGSKCSDIQTVTIEEILESSQLQGSVSPTRIGGLTNVLQAIQNRVTQAMTRIKEEESTSKSVQTHPLEGRWSDRQGEDVAVLLSGGVDSSVAMRLAMESGARVHPFYLKIWLDDEMAHLGECPWEEDIKYASAVCEQIGVKLQDVPFQKDYWDEVVSYTIAEARRGRTPNPDVMCNSRIKFGAFLNRIGKHYDRVVSGHYATTRLCEESGMTELLVSADKEKDQTYFLAHLNQQQLKHVSFPIGGFLKNQVRELAAKYDLPNKTRKDSQGICFLGKLKFDEFLAHHLGYEKGSLVEFETGNELGFHRGFWFFTLGQRRGVGLSGGPWYVVAKDPGKNIVYVSRSYYSADMERNCFEFEDVLWITECWPKTLSQIGSSTKMRVKTRHCANFHDAIVTRLGNETGRVKLAVRDKGLAPGQFAAFYDYEDRCLGSGIIAVDASLARPPDSIIPMTKKSARLQANF